MEDFTLIILCRAEKRHLLASTLDTLKFQQGSFEVLVVEEGPGSQFASLRESYLDLKMKVEWENGNLARMMNRGLAKARGTYVQFLEPGDRYISQQGLIFLKELVATQPQFVLDKGGHFSWLKKDTIIEAGGFNEAFQFCPMQDLLCRFELRGIQPLVSPRVLIDSPHEVKFSLWENSQILYRHFGLKRTLNWFFIQNWPHFMQRATRFIKQSFWQE